MALVASLPEVGLSYFAQVNHLTATHGLLKKIWVFIAVSICIDFLPKGRVTFAVKCMYKTLSIDLYEKGIVAG